jgi:uncharacterized protein with HEPN domain
VSSELRQWGLFIDDMIRSIRRISAICGKHTLDTFAADQDSLELVTHHFEILGEASRHIPQGVMDEHPEIPWRVIQSTRNRIVHGYFSVSATTLWLSVNEDLPGLLPQLQELRAEAPDQS